VHTFTGVHTKNTLSCFELTGQNRKEREQKKNHFSQLVLKGQAAKKRGGIGDSMVMLSFIEYYLNIRSICLHC
jgi:hypothetical protein